MLVALHLGLCNLVAHGEESELQMIGLVERQSVAQTVVLLLEGGSVTKLDGACSLAKILSPFYPNCVSNSLSAHRIDL